MLVRRGALLARFRGLTPRVPRQVASISTLRLDGPVMSPPAGTKVSDVLLNQAAKTPAADAVLFGSAVLSYEALVDRVFATAASLAASGIRPGTHVGALFARSEQTVIFMAALFHLGAVYIPLDESYPIARIAHMIHGGNVSVILADAENVDKIPESYTGTVLMLEKLPKRSADAGVELNRGSGDDTAYIVFTSGSTGPPKAITLNHESLITSISCIQHPDVAFLRDVRTWVCAAATSFTVSLLEIWGSICSGRRAYITSPMRLAGDWYQVRRNIIRFCAWPRRALDFIEIPCIIIPFGAVYERGIV